MSSISTAAPLTAPQAAAKPRFWGLIWGELFKIMHQRMNWMMLPILYFFSSVRWLVLPLQGRQQITTGSAALCCAAWADGR